MNIPQLWKHARIFSFGAGTQSIAVMVAQAQGLLAQPYDYFVWADVGADSENAAVHPYIADYVVPYMREYEMRFVRVAKTRYGKEDTVLQAIMRNNRSIPIPVRMSNGAPGNRTCTADYKIKVVDKWARQHFTHITIGLGFSIDESRRAKSKNTAFAPATKGDHRLYKRFDFPLFPLQMTRLQSIRLVESAGLPTPPRSSCWFCPFRSRSEWIEDLRYNPQLIQNAALVEAILNRKRKTISKDRFYLHPSTGGHMHPLTQAIGDQMSLFEEPCDSGYCGL